MAFALEKTHRDNFFALQESLAKLLGGEKSTFLTREITPAGYVSPLNHILQTKPHPYDEGATRDYEIASWQIMQLPGCCGIAMSYHGHTQSDFRRKGIGRLLLRWRMWLAWHTKYTYFQATTRVDWADGIKLLESEGFKEIKQFRNRRTDNHVRVYLRELTEKDGDWNARAEEVIKRKATK